MGNKKLFNVFENWYFKIYCQQVRQTRPNSGGGGVAEGQPRFDKGGGCNNFLRVKI